MIIPSILSFSGALLSVHGYIDFSTFVVLTIPGLTYGSWLAFHPEVSIDIVIEHTKAYATAGTLMSVASVWYLYMVFSTGQYSTLIYYAIVSVPVMFLSGYFAIKKAEQYSL